MATPEPEQLILTHLIAALEAEDPTRVLPVGFHNPHSYRGYYEDLAFELTINITVGAMLTAARGAIGSIYQGWKGGDYQMGENTQCWLVAREGQTGESLGRVLLSLLLAKPAKENR